MAKWVGEPVLSLRQLGSLLWGEFDPWPGNFPMQRAWPKNIYHIGLLFKIKVGQTPAVLWHLLYFVHGGFFPCLFLSFTL